MSDHWKSSLFVQRAWKHVWIHGFVIGVGFVLIGFVVWFLIKDTPSPPTSHPGEPAPQVQVPQVQAPQVQAQAGASPQVNPPVAPQTPVDSAPPLQSQLAQVLAGIGQANQKKDLTELLSYYSPSFPQLQQRTQQISQNWKIYDYPKMDFAMTEVRLLADQTAVARVTWNVEAHNISTLKNRHISKTYLIKFTRESGQWRIKALDKAE
jgi:hypothetical protein